LEIPNLVAAEVKEADDLSKFHNPDPLPHLGGYIFQTGS
jgi:hypothetical protein